MQVIEGILCSALKDCITRVTDTVLTIAGMKKRKICLCLSFLLKKSEQQGKRTKRVALLRLKAAIWKAENMEI